MQTQNHTQSQTRIVAAILDTKCLKLYKQDGQSIEIPQGDARIRRILEVATPAISRQGFADVDLSHEDDNTYQDFEQKTNGVVRFFRVAKKRLRTFFKTEVDEPQEPMAVGVIPVLRTEAEKVEALQKATEEILKHAVPAAAPEFHTATVAKQANIVEANGVTPGRDEESSAPDTMIAVVDNKIVPGVEKIHTQFTNAVKKNSTKGMENLLRRLSAVIHERNHSVEDLLKFLERGDLPVADDGSILIYKVLRKADNGKGYVDCHTRKVPQKVGSYVCMDQSLVDPNRRNECSNGLHVARRGYVGGFSGDVCVLAKLAPEDVIAVPSYDANKMRVCGYHIIFELPEAMYALLRSNKPITDTEEGKKLLGMALAGQHIGKIEEVRITEHQGGGIKITPLVTEPEQPPAVPAKEVRKEEALVNADEAQKDAPVDPKAVVAEVTTLSRKDTAKGLYDTYQRVTDPDEKATALQALLDFKRSTKVGWDKLGLPDLSNAKVTAAPKTNTPTSKEGKAMTPREEIQHLLPKYRAANGKEKTEFAHDILKLKKQAKKSWEVLGVPKADEEGIKLRTAE